MFLFVSLYSVSISKRVMTSRCDVNTVWGENGYATVTDLPVKKILNTIIAEHRNKLFYRIRDLFFLHVYCFPYQPDTQLTGSSIAKLVYVMIVISSHILTLTRPKSKVHKLYGLMVWRTPFCFRKKSYVQVADG